MAKMSLDKSGILSRVSEAKSFTKGWHNNIEHWRDLYDGLHYRGITPNPGETQYVDPTHMNAVDLTNGILQANRMSWKAFGFSPSYKEERESSKAEKLMTAILDINEDRNEVVIPFELNMHFSRDGGGVIYQVWDKNLAQKETITFLDDDGKEAKKSVYTTLPIVMQIIDPLSIILLPGGPKRWLAVGHIDMMTIADIETLYNVKLEQFAAMSETDKLKTRVEFIDWWEFVRNGTKWVVTNAKLVQDEFVQPQRDVSAFYDDLPYTIDFYNPTDRYDSSKWHNVLTPLEHSVAMLERSFNRRARQIDVFASMPLVAKTATGRHVDVDPGVGKVLELTADEDFGWPEWRGNPPDVTEHMEFLRARVQQSGYSDVMYGSGNSQISGYAMSQLGDQNRIRLEQPVAHLVRLWGRVGNKALDIVRRHAKGIPILVYGHLRGTDFSDYVSGADLDGIRIECEIKPEFPNEQVRKTAMASQVKGILADGTIMERFLGVEQPDDERAKKLIEIVEQNPQVVQYMVIAELKDRAQNGDDVALMVMQQIMSSGMNQGGRPDGAPKPENMNGMASATGGFSPQEQGVPEPGQSETDMMNNMANARPSLLGGGVI